MYNEHTAAARFLFVANWCRAIFRTYSCPRGTVGMYVHTYVCMYVKWKFGFQLPIPSVFTIILLINMCDDMKGTGFEEPTQIGNYEIVKPIGKGKFAVVYRARRIDSPSDENIVALKRISVDLIDDKTRGIYYFT